MFSKIAVKSTSFALGVFIALGLFIITGPPSEAETIPKGSSGIVNPIPSWVLAESSSQETIASAEAKNDTVFVREFRFMGNTVISSGDLQQLVRDLKGQRLSLDEIRSLLQNIRAYQERGYILAKPYVPEQDKHDGILEIAIVEGNIGQVHVTGNQYYKDRVICRYFDQQIRQGVIRESALERAVLLTNDVPSCETKVVLKRGEEPGTSDIWVEAEDNIAFEWGIEYNNYGNELTDDDRYGTRFQIADPWWATILDVRGNTGDDPNDSSLARASWTIPINCYGTELLLNYLSSNYALGGGLADLGLEGEAKMYGAFIYHPILRTSNLNLSVSAGYERKYLKTFLQEDIDNTRDKEDVWSVRLDFDNLDRYLGKNFISLGYYHGRVRDTDGIFLSRTDADTTFDRLTLDVVRVQRIYTLTNVLLRGSGQISGDRLVSLEQFILGGYGSVRGHDPALHLGDSGYTLSAELMVAPPFISDKEFFGQKLSQLLQLALFLDHGGVFTSDTSASESHSEYLTGWGAGIRVFYKDRFAFKFDFGKPIDDKDSSDKNTFYYFSVELNFF